MTSGKKSQFQLTRLAASYNEMQRDGRLLSNRASIEVVRKRISQLSERIDFNDAPDRLRVLGDLWEEYKMNLALSKPMDAMESREKLDAQFEAAHNDYAAWKQMLDAIDLDRKLVESEVKVAKDLHAMLTSEEAYELSAKLLAAVLRVVTDPHQLKAIQYEFTRVTGEGTIIETRQGSGQIIDS